ncbi:MAG: hypothetical protein CMI09_14075 [Oceanospirillaceae bacterium]|nr:hypothetical protein [Oceanospirillaceae bacterium]
MATLRDGDLTFEFTFVRYYDPDAVGWLDIRFSFLWQGIPVFNDAVLKRSNDYWNERGPGEFLVRADIDDHLLAVLEYALASDQLVSWEPVEPDVSISLYPDFRMAHWGESGEQPGKPSDTEATATRSPDAKPSHAPNDWFTLTVVVDLYQFRGADSYGGSGPGIQMVVRRAELNDFVQQLRAEFEVLIQTD